MRPDPFAPSGTVHVGGAARPAAEVWSALAPLLTPARRQRILDVTAGRSFAVATVLECVEGPGNVAAVLRTSEGIGFPAVHVIGAPGEAPVPWPNHVTCGAHKWLDVRHWNTGDPWIERLRTDGYRVLVTRVGEGPTLDEVDFSRPTAVVFGNERKGVTEATAQAADGCFSIPMAGFTRSFNVSVAAAMVLHHARRARAAAGGGELTDDQRLVLAARYALLSRPGAARLPGLETGTSS